MVTRSFLVSGLPTGPRIGGAYHRCARDRVGNYLCSEPKNLFNQLGIDHVAWCSGGDNRTVFHDDEMIGVTCCLVQIMQHRDDGFSLFMEIPQ